MAGGLDRKDVLGTVESTLSDDAGFQVRVELDNIIKQIQKARDHTADLSAVLNASFANIHGIKGMKWGESRTSTSTIKENNMSGTRILQTPSKNIKRKDLTVALRLIDFRGVDDLYDVVALVQSVGENEKVFRTNELKAEDVVGKYIRVHGRDEATGGCSDFAKDEPCDYTTRVVLDGKLHAVTGGEYLIVSEIKGPEEPLGEDALRLVRD